MTFFTSDLHFWHRKIIDLCGRPWTSVEEMNTGLIERWNSVVREGDLVYILGDMFFCGTNKAKEIMNQLRGRKILIRGNHDWNVIKPHRAEEFGFESVTDDFYRRTLGGHTIGMCHFPYAGDHTTEERYKEKRPIDDGSWLLHGHVHSLWKVREKQINVGVDVWDWYPVPQIAIERILNERST